MIETDMNTIWHSKCLYIVSQQISPGYVNTAMVSHMIHTIGYEAIEPIEVAEMVIMQLSRSANVEVRDVIIESRDSP